MPYAHGGLCPMPVDQIVPDVTEKGYITNYPLLIPNYQFI
jgi:hypothetical protein